MKYYFIYYKCKRYSRRGDIPPLSEGSAYTVNEMECQGIIGKHPLQFQIDCNKKYGEEHNSNGYLVKEDCTIISWQELSEKEFEKYRGEIG